MDSVLGHHRTGWFAQVSNGFAGFSDAATGGMTGYLRRGLGYDDVIDHSSWAYQGGFVTGEVAGFAATFVSPCGLVTSARWGVRAINAAQGVSGLLSAQEQWEQGNYLAAALDATGSVLNFTQLFKACFTGEMLLDTAVGRKRADQIKRGDRLWCRPENDPNGELVLRSVEEVFVRVAPILEVYIAGQAIRTTGEHPFWVENRRRWLAAGELRVGDKLRTRDGELVSVERIVDCRKFETVYNWRIAEHHTYYVSASETSASIWAHNAEYSIRTGSKPEHAANSSEPGTFSIRDWTGYPSDIPKPQGPFRLLKGAEYEASRKAANQANAALRRSDPVRYAGKQIHEIHLSNLAVIR